jgi:hypothetical protein
MLHLAVLVLAANATLNPESVTRPPAIAHPQLLMETSTGPATQKAAAKVAAAPTSVEVAAAIKHLFKDAVLLDTTRQPNFAVGDFNWDGTQDLVAIVKPAEGALDEINSEFAHWILEDPKKVTIPDFERAVVRESSSSRTSVAKGDILLAIIHGKASDGWRDAKASHGFLLKTSVVADLRSVSRAEFNTATKDAVRKVRTVRGDVIGLTQAGEHGFLIFTGKYGWYNPMK